MTERLQSIRPRLEELARLDSQCGLFGASTHRYQLAPPMKEDEVRTFELLHGIRLPDGYREFLLVVGSAGAGPYYGLHPLGNFEQAIGHLGDEEGEPEGWRWGTGLVSDFLTTPFPGGDGWVESPDEEELSDEEVDERMEQWEKEAWDNRWVAGTLCIAEYGCGIRELLVISGSERGAVWRDARCDGVALYPVMPNFERRPSAPNSNYTPMFEKAENERCSFLDWYEWWLDWSLEEVGR